MGTGNPNAANAAGGDSQRGDKNMVLMFTDVVDSVAIKRRIGDVAYVEALREHLRRLRDCVLAEPGAVVIKSTGDGILARFAMPGDAVRAALRMQAGGGTPPASVAMVKNAGEPPAFQALPDRIGIHAGAGIETIDPNGNPDVAGLAVDMAARVMGLCGAGQILLTRAAFDDARQFVREHPCSADVSSAGARSDPATTGRPEVEEPARHSRAATTVREGAHPPVIQWMAHGPYLFKGSDDALEVFEVGTAGLAPLKAPKDSEKARRAVTPGEEAMYDWRPAVGLDLPRRQHYVLDRKLGEGGFGEVWLARHRKTGDRRVFKFCFDADRLRSFRRELTLFRLLKEALGDRRDIARIFDVSLESPPFFLESEYAPGGDLYHWAATRGGIGTLSLEQRLDMLRRIADAVAAAHSVGVLHKDLKPSNVLMDVAEDGSPRPKLADFGIGILADRSRLEGAGFTIAGFTQGGLTMNDSSRTGTRLYSPPESLTSVKTTDGEPAKPAPFTAKGDVYALGVMLYQFVIGDLDRPLAIGWERNVEGSLGIRSDPAATGQEEREDSARHRRATTKEVTGSGNPSHCDPHLLAVITGDIADMVEGDPERRLDSAAEVARRLATVNERRAQLEQDAIAAQAAEAADRRAALADLRRRKTRTIALVSVGTMVLLLSIGAIALFNVMAARDEALRERDRADRQMAVAVAAKSDAELQRGLAERESIRAVAERDLAAAALRALREEEFYRQVTSVLDAKDSRAKIERLLESGPPLDKYGQELKQRADANKYFNPLLDRLEGHDGEVRAIQYSPDGRMIATASSDTTIRIWDALTGQQVGKPLEGHTQTIWDLRFSPDGKLLASCSDDGTIRVWNTGTWGLQYDALTGHTGPVCSVSFSSDNELLASGSSDRTIRLWNVRTGELHGEPLIGHTNELRSVLFDPKGRFLASGGIDCTLRLWDINTGKEVVDPVRHENTVSSIQIDSIGGVIVAGIWGGTISVHDFGSDPLLLRLRVALTGHRNDIHALALHPSGRLLASGSMDTTVRVWDLSTGQPVGVPLTGHTSQVFKVHFSPNGKELASGSGDGTACTWDIETISRFGEPLRGHEERVHAIAFSQAAGMIASGAFDNSVRLWDARSNTGLGSPLVGHLDWVRAVAINPKGTLLASASFDGTVRVWRVDGTNMTAGGLAASRESVPSTESVQPIAVLTEGIGRANCLAFSPDGLLLVCGGENREIQVWSTESFNLVGEPLVGHLGTVYSLAFLGDGRTLVSGSADRSVRLWDLTSRIQIGPALIGHRSEVWAVAVSPCKRFLASGGLDSRIVIWDISAREVVGKPLVGHRDWVTSVAWNSEGTILASGSYDGSVRLWNTKGLGSTLSTPFTLFSLVGHRNRVSAVAFSHDDMKLVSASYDRTLRVWSLPDPTSR